MIEVDDEHYADDLDRAARTTNIANQEAIAARRRKAAPEQVMNKDGTWPTTDCEDCGNPIPEGRLALGRVRCILCQTAKEKKENGYGLG